MHIDYVRIYQKPGHENITCDLPGYPTTEYIKNHTVAYNNPNLTVSLCFLWLPEQELVDLAVVGPDGLYLAEKQVDGLLKRDDFMTYIDI